MFRTEKVWKKIWKNKGIYLIMVVEFSLGIAFLAYAFNHIFSYMDNIKELRQEMSDMTVSVEVSQEQEEESEYSQPFDYSDCAAIEDRADGLEVFLCVPNLLLKGGEFEEVYFVFTNLMQERGKFCAGTKIRESMSGEFQVYDGEDGVFSPDRIRYYGEEYKRADMPDSLNGKIIIRNMSEGRLYADRCIFFSLQDWNERQQVAPAQVLIQYEVQDTAVMDETNQEILGMLSKAHPEYTYRVSNYLDDYEQNNESTMEYAKYMMVLSVIGIWIMVFGYMGLTRQFYVKRQKEFAVCLAVGATARELCREMVLEEIVVLACGVIGGNVGAWYLSGFRKDEILNVGFHAETVIISIVLVLVIIAGINLPVYRRIQRLKPQELLRSL